jgi:hypothetical protein
MLGDVMKKTAVLVSIAVLILLMSCSASSPLNHQLTREQDGPVSAYASETNPSTLLGEEEHSTEETSSGKAEDCAIQADSAGSGEILSDAEDASKACEGSLQNDKVENALNIDIPLTEAPIPNGRIFYRGESPYGYLPTCSPKPNSSFPIIPLELD